MFGGEMRVRGCVGVQACACACVCARARVCVGVCVRRSFWEGAGHSQAGGLH